MAWFGSNFMAGRAARKAAAAAPEALEKTFGYKWGKSGLIKGPLKVLGTGGLVVAGASALAYFSSRARRSRDVEHLPPPPDDLAQPLPSIPDFSGDRQVLGPHTARVLGVANNAAVQPNLMGGDGKPVENLGTSLS